MNAKTSLNPTKSKMAIGPILAAIVSGIYVAIFYITNNLTMLPWSSMLLMAVALVVPVSLGITILTLIFNRQGWRGVNFLSIFVSVSYVLLLMRLPVFEIEVIAEIVGTMPSNLRILTKVLFCILPAFLFAYMCRKNTNGYVFTLSIVSLSALAMAVYSQNITSSLDEYFGSATQKALSNVTMSSTPNIYLILTDGYSNFAYLEENNFDAAELKSTLRSNGFTLYPEMFSNYHSTLAAMPAMLNMEHHYYSASQSNNITETSKSGRVIIGGNNNVVKFLKNNNYETHYIHHGTYLLLHGCSATTCYPDVSFAGARAILKRVLFPSPIHKDELFEKVPLDQIFTKADELRMTRENSSQPQFQYMHIYSPAHTPNEKASRCNMGEELELYKNRTSNANKTLSKVLSSIVENDSSAVIILTADHGPFISNECARNADIDSLSAYRDRVGALTAVRWPETYDGRYDKRMLTTVNLFRYVFASLVDNNQAILSSVVPDNVYIRGESNVLKIMDDGKVLLPPVIFEKGNATSKTRRKYRSKQ